MRGIRALLLDIDGFLCIRDKVIEGAVRALEEIRKSYKVALVTNTTRVSSRAIYEKLISMGFFIQREELFTALSVAKTFLLKKRASAYLLTTEKAKEEFEDTLEYPMKYVLVADAYKNFTYESLNQGFRYLLEGADLLAVAPNRYFMDKDGRLSLDSGPFVKALEYASGKRAKVLGKPSRRFFNIVLKSLGVSKEEALMVGDDIEFDILGAQRYGLRAVLVKTGKFREEDLKRGIKPDYIIDSIADLPGLLTP